MANTYMPHGDQDGDITLNGGSSTTVALPQTASAKFLVKVTAYRLIVTMTILGFGLAKYLLTGKGKVVEANTLDFIVGVPLAILCVVSQIYYVQSNYYEADLLPSRIFWIGFLEGSASSWLFEYDFSDYILPGLITTGKQRPLNAS